MKTYEVAIRDAIAEQAETIKEKMARFDVTKDQIWAGCGSKYL